MNTQSVVDSIFKTEASHGEDFESRSDAYRAGVQDGWMLARYIAGSFDGSMPGSEVYKCFGVSDSATEVLDNCDDAFDVVRHLHKYYHKSIMVGDVVRVNCSPEHEDNYYAVVTNADYDDLLEECYVTVMDERGDCWYPNVERLTKVQPEDPAMDGYGFLFDQIKGALNQIKAACGKKEVTGDA